MSYLWQDFNIKTFPAETIVYRDGVFCPELSTLQSLIIDKKYDLPIHIIYIGEISGENNVNIDLSVPEQKMFISVKITSKKPAILNFFLKNAGKSSEIRGHMVLFNESELKFNVFAGHFEENTGIFVHTKLLAGKNSVSSVGGNAIIYKNCKNCDSDLSFSALAEKGAKITFKPAQKISCIPNNAKHGAGIFEPKKQQIEYLRESGLSGAEVKDALHEAFINDLNLF